MDKTNYPYTAWVLMPSFKPVEVRVCAEAGYGSSRADWHITDKGKTYHSKDLFETKEQAIAAGHERLDKQQAEIDKKQKNLDKRRVTLNNFDPM